MTGIPPDPNRVRGMHWATLRRAQRDFRMRVAWEAMAVRDGPPLARARVTATVCKIGVPFDTDNCTALLKPVLDGLKGILIIDDAPDHMELVVRQDYGRPRGVRLEIEEVVG